MNRTFLSAIALLLCAGCRGGGSRHSPPTDIQRTTKSVTPASENPLLVVRNRLLWSVAADWGIDDPDEVWAVVMDIGMDAGNVTLVANMVGDASIYFSPGGGVIGGFAHESVERAAKVLCQTAKRCLGAAASVDDFGFPMAGRVRFYLLTPSDVRAIEADEHALRGGGHVASELFEAAHGVITELREISEAVEATNS